MSNNQYVSPSGLIMPELPAKFSSLVPPDKRRGFVLEAFTLARAIASQFRDVSRHVLTREESATAGNGGSDSPEAAKHVARAFYRGAYYWAPVGQRSDLRFTAGAVDYGATLTVAADTVRLELGAKRLTEDVLRADSMNIAFSYGITLALAQSYQKEIQQGGAATSSGKFVSAGNPDHWISGMGSALLDHLLSVDAGIKKTDAYAGFNWIKYMSAFASQMRQTRADWGRYRGPGQSEQIRQFMAGYKEGAELRDELIDRCHDLFNDWRAHRLGCIHQMLVWEGLCSQMSEVATDAAPEAATAIA